MQKRDTVSAYTFLSVYFLFNQLLQETCLLSYVLSFLYSSNSYLFPIFLRVTF
jgi:hypothetical protein